MMAADTLRRPGEEHVPLLAVLALVAIVAYAVGSAYHLVGSLVVGDVIAPALAFVVLLHPASARFLLSFFADYLIVPLVLALVLFTPALVMPDAFGGLKFGGQMMFVAMVTVPLIALGVSMMRHPLVHVQTLVWGMLLFYLAGAISWFVLGNGWMLYRTGIGRVLSKFILSDFFVAGYTLALIQIAVRARGIRTAGSWLMAGACVIPVLLSATRTYLLAMTVVTLVAAILAVRHRRQGLALIGIAGVAGAVAVGVWLQRLLNTRILGGAALVDDSGRFELMRRTVATLWDEPMRWLVGGGWGNSGANGTPVHNFVLQATAEGGLFPMVALTAFAFLPALLARRNASLAEDERWFVYGTQLSLLVFLGLNAFSVERIYWIMHAITLGIALKGHGGSRETVA